MVSPVFDNEMQDDVGDTNPQGKRENNRGNIPDKPANQVSCDFDPFVAMFHESVLAK
jgi:hypothetical protein